ncbi:MauE/DoxX family redox-associated membrane protein [Thermodesulfobacteriota bacterium]
MMMRNSAVLACRLALGGIFLYASLDKIAHPDQFAAAVANYRLLPGILVNLFAIFLPWAEFICGLLLVAGLFSSGSLAVILGMLCVFIVAVGINMARGLDISCGCFDTVEGRVIGVRLLLEDLGMVAIGIMIMLFDDGSWSLSRLLRRRTKTA